jgi:hypothetical protein
MIRTPEDFPFKKYRKAQKVSKTAGTSPWSSESVCKDFMRSAKAVAEPESKKSQNT